MVVLQGNMLYIMLCCVVGHMNGGHYTAFVNCHDQMEASVLANTINSNSSSSSSSSSSSRGTTNLSNCGIAPTSLSHELEPDELMDCISNQLLFNPKDATSFLAGGMYGSCSDMSSIHSTSYLTGSEFDSIHDGKWFLFDDEIVEEVPSECLNQNIVTGTFT